MQKAALSSSEVALWSAPIAGTFQVLCPLSHLSEQILLCSNPLTEGFQDTLILAPANVGGVSVLSLCD